MKKNILKYFGLGFVALTLVVGVGAVQANAALTMSALSVASDGALTVNSTTTNALTLDSTSTGAVNLGTSSNAKTITIGNITGATGVAIKAGSGKVVITGELDATSPVFVTPTLGAATATTVNKVTITAPATSSTLTVADGSTLATSGAFPLTLTSTASTNVTLPTTGTLATLAGTEALTNKTLTAPVINGATSASGNFDLSGSNGTFKTTTGAVTIGPGAVTLSGATLASSSTNKGVATLVAGSATATVTSGSVCVVSLVTNVATPQYITGAVSGTTLTITSSAGASTDQVAYLCF